jgi:hypothetical protein
MSKYGLYNTHLCTNTAFIISNYVQKMTGILENYVPKLPFVYFSQLDPKITRRNSSLNKHNSKISQETLLNSVSNEWLPLMVGQSHDSFTLLSVKDVMLFQHCQQAIYLVCTGYR